MHLICCHLQQKLQVQVTALLEMAKHVTLNEFIQSCQSGITYLARKIFPFFVIA